MIFLGEGNIDNYLTVSYIKKSLFKLDTPYIPQKLICLNIRSNNCHPHAILQEFYTNTNWFISIHLMMSIFISNHLNMLYKLLFLFFCFFLVTEKAKSQRQLNKCYTNLGEFTLWVQNFHIYIYMSYYVFYDLYAWHDAQSPCAQCSNLQATLWRCLCLFPRCKCIGC